MTSSTSIPISDTISPVTIQNVNDGRRKLKPCAKTLRRMAAELIVVDQTASSESARAIAAVR